MEAQKDLSLDWGEGGFIPPLNDMIEAGFCLRDIGEDEDAQDCFHQVLLVLQQGHDDPEDFLPDRISREISLCMERIESKRRRQKVNS